VAVSAPADAVDRETADLIIEVTNLNDIEDRSLIRFVAVVDSTEDLLDEGKQADLLSGRTDKK
jgi:hypothetical protein